MERLKKQHSVERSSEKKSTFQLSSPQFQYFLNSSDLVGGWALQSPTRDFPTFQSSKFPSRWPNRMKKSCGGGGTSRVAAAAAEATIMATGSWRNHERNHVVCIYHLVITINGWDYGWIILIIICDISIINSNNPECHPLVGYTPHLYGFVWK